MKKNTQIMFFLFFSVVIILIAIFYKEEKQVSVLLLFIGFGTMTLWLYHYGFITNSPKLTDEIAAISSKALLCILGTLTIISMFLMIHFSRNKKLEI